MQNYKTKRSKLFKELATFQHNSNKCFIEVPFTNGDEPLPNQLNQLGLNNNSQFNWMTFPLDQPSIYNQQAQWQKCLSQAIHFQNLMQLTPIIQTVTEPGDGYQRNIIERPDLSYSYQAVVLMNLASHTSVVSILIWNPTSYKSTFRKRVLMNSTSF